MDPRRAERVVAFKPKIQDAESIPPDLKNILALICGVLGLTMKQKWAAWLAVFCTLSSLTNLKTSDMDIKQIVCSVTFAIMGLLMNYFQPEPPVTPSKS